MHIGDWVVLRPHSRGDGVSAVRPRDTRFLAGNVFEVLEVHEEVAIVGDGSVQLQVSLALLHRTEAVDVHRAGTCVALKDGTQGTVEEIQWHFTRDMQMYFLSVGGKRRSKRYWDDELRDLSR